MAATLVVVVEHVQEVFVVLFVKCLHLIVYFYLLILFPSLSIYSSCSYLMQFLSQSFSVM